MDSFILTTNFPYAMIPHKHWDNRLKTLVTAGFNCIDLRLFWNFHEVSENEWLFKENRDIEKLIKLVRKNGLLIIAHTGPYVDHIWDGGGIPSYILSKMDPSAKSVNSVLLEHIGTWYEKILPVLKKYERSDATPDGIILNVEIAVPEDMYTQLNTISLKKLYDKFELNIPCNVSVVKPNDTVKFHSSHNELKLQLARGRKTLDAGYFVGGFCFDFNNTITSTGTSGAFVSSAVGENTLISPFGEANLAELTGMRLLKRFINTLGDSLFNGQPVTNHGISTIPDIDVAAYAMDGGILIACTNKSTDSMSFSLSEKGLSYPNHTKLRLMPGECRFITRNFSLSSMGIRAVIEYCTTEVVFSKYIGSTLYIMLLSDGDSEFCISGVNISVMRSDMPFIESIDKKSLTAFFADESEIKLSIDNKKVRIISLSRETAAAAESIDDTGLMNCINITPVKTPRIISHKSLPVHSRSINLPLNFTPIGEGKSKYMEKNNIYKGFAYYSADVRLPPAQKNSSIIGVIIHRAADIISVYVNGSYLVTQTPFGAHTFIEPYSTEMQIIGDHFIEVPVKKWNTIKPPADNSNLYNFLIKSEIYGHTFRQSDMLPSLRTSSMKGIQGISLVISKKEIPLKCKVRPESSGSLGIYSMHNAKIIVNGKHVTTLRDNYRYAEIAPYIRLKTDNDIEIVCLDKGSMNHNNKYYFVEGIKADNYKIAGFSADTLLDAYSSSDEALKTMLPYKIKEGEERFISFDLSHSAFNTGASFKVLVKGSGIKVTALFNDTITGRVWLPGRAKFAPPMLYGPSNYIYLPNSLFIKGLNTLTFFIEGVSDKNDCVLEGVDFISIEDF